MPLDYETRQKIADIIYELNVEPDEVDNVVDQIEGVLPRDKITIDLAGVMDKVTPEMIDETRDLMIDALTKRCTKMREALKPFAGRVFNDNGDVTLSDTHTLSIDDYTRAYFAYRAEVPKDETLQALEQDATPGKWGQFSTLNGPWQEQAKALWAQDRKAAAHAHDSSHHMSAMKEDGTPYRIATFTHAADAAFAEYLVNKYRKGML